MSERPSPNGIIAARYTGITQEDIAEMTDAELAALAAKAPKGFTPVMGNGQFVFVADWVIERMSPTQREQNRGDCPHTLSAEFPAADRKVGGGNAGRQRIERA